MKKPFLHQLPWFFHYFACDFQAQNHPDNMEDQRPPLPLFTEETAQQKIQMAEDAWNSKDPVRVSKAYTPDSEWRNRHLFLNGRAEIVQFLTANSNDTT